MAVRCRATFFFKDTNDHGWTETIFNLASDLTLCMTRAKSLLQERRNLLGSTAALVFVRVSDDLVKRDSMIYKVPFGDQNSRSERDAPADIANTSLVVRIQAQPTVRRTLYMRGVPDSCIQNSGVYTPSERFLGLFTDWVSVLQAEGWACRTVDKTVTPVPITNVTWDPVTTRATITVGTPHGLTITDVAVIRGVKGATQVNGQWSIMTVLNTLQIEILVKQVVGAWAGGGGLSKSGYLLFPILDAEVMRVSHRIAGRPFDSPVGRRRAR